MARSRHPAVLDLDRSLKARTVEADPRLVETLPGARVRCLACGHRCVILEGLDGICRVRFNHGGRLRVPRGYVGALQVDPVEKKPFFHVLPGRPALSFGMLGCDYHCGYCQNWLTSQALRDPAALSGTRDIEPAELVARAVASGAPVMVSTYNEPLITSEWAVEVFRAAGERGMLCGYVSNGNATPVVIDYLRPFVELYKVDLKGFRDKGYRSLGGTLANVVESIRALHGAGFWVEIVTLVVPGFNDSAEELRDAADFLVSVSPEIPWHLTAFHRDYKMTDRRDTTAEQLIRAAEIGKAAGLQFVYVGNLPGRVGSWENTCCPGCGALLVERHGFTVVRDRLSGNGCCPECGRNIPGRWHSGSVACK